MVDSGESRELHCPMSGSNRTCFPLGNGPVYDLLMIRKLRGNSVATNPFTMLAAACAASLAMFGWQPSALAQAQSRFGDKGQLAITGENLFAFSTQREGTSFPDGEHSRTDNRFGFLYSQGSASPRGPHVRRAFFIIPSLSIGATLGYEARGGSITTPEGNRGLVTRDTENMSTFILVPRVGYALMFNDIIGFWFRGGVGYFRIGTSDPVDTRIKQSSSFGLLSLDALFVVSPVQHFGFYVGPTADISFTGSHSPTDQNGIEFYQSANHRSLGLGLGLIGYLGL